jgi:CheY-like chemotaxis protein
MPHILVIDDRPLHRIPFQEQLGGFGITIAAAAHGKRSIEEYRQHQPNLVIVDMKMSEVDEMETIFNLRELEPDLPILLTDGGVPLAFLDGSDGMPDDGHEGDLLQAVRQCLLRNQQIGKDTRAAAGAP